MPRFLKAARLSELTPGAGTLAVLEGIRIALFRCDGAVYAIKGSCPHMGGELWEGALNGEIVTCPWHGWRFNVRTGTNPAAEVVAVRTYEVRIEGDDVYVAL